MMGRFESKNRGRRGEKRSSNFRKRKKSRGVEVYQTDTGEREYPMGLSTR